MCLDSKRKIASTDFWKRAVTACGKSDTLLSSPQWQDGKPSTAYEVCNENTWKTKSTVFWERNDNMWKPHPLLSETAVTTYGNPSTAYWMWCENTRKKTSIAAWNRAVTTCEKLIHCLVKQQKQHVEIHQQLIKCDVATHGKQYPLFFESE